MLQKFAMVKYGVFVAKICKHALCASTVRDIWWSPLARQLLPPCPKPNWNLFENGHRIKRSCSAFQCFSCQIRKVDWACRLCWTSRQN